MEAREFRDAQKKFEAANAVIVGVSPDKVAKQCKFKERYDLNFTLLADEDHALAEAYGAWTQKSMMGRKYMGVERSTAVIGPDGRIAKVYPKVKALGHAEQVLRDIKTLT